MNFILRHLYNTPTWLLDKQIFSYIDYTGHIGKIRTAQDRNLNLLFQPARLMRMEENEELNGSMAYTMDQLFSDTRKSIFSNGRAKADAIKRGLQRAYIEKMKDLLESEDDKVLRSDIQALAHGNLIELIKTLGKAKSNDKSMQYHNAELVARIAEILDED